MTLEGQEKLLITAEEAADLLSISLRHLERSLADGQIPDWIIVRIGKRRLFSLVLIREWIARKVRLAGEKAG